jgi:PAS domain S-box-containing protein
LKIDIATDISNARILIVDDKEEIRQILQEMLNSAGFKAETVENASAAQERLLERSFDAVFTDIAMPDMDGIDFLKKIREILPDMQVVLVTGYPSVETASKAVRAGAYDYLTKPVTQEVLTRVAKRAVETKRLKEEKRRLAEENYQYGRNLEKLVTAKSRELLKSKKRYALATSAGKVGVWDLDFEFGEIYIDPNLKAMLGYEDHEIGNHRDDLQRLVHADDMEKLIKAAKAHFDGLTPQLEVTHRMLHRDGTTRWFLTRGTALWDAMGETYRMVGTQSDITNQKLAEEELKKRNRILEAVRFISEALLRSAVWDESINEVLERLGSATKVSRVYIFENSRADNGDLLAKHRHEWINPEIKPKIKSLEFIDFSYEDAGFGRWERTLGKSRLIKGFVRNFPKAEHEALTHRNILSIIVVPIFVESQWWGFISFEECLVERDWSLPEIETFKVAAGTLGAAIYREQQGMERMRLATAIEQSRESIIITDSDGIIEYVNPAFEVITGYKKDEAVGQRPTNLLKSGRQDNQFYREMWETIKNGNVWRGHFINKKKAGALFEEDAAISPVKNAEGKIINYVAIKRDVTEKKRLESIAEAANLMKNIGYVFSGIRHEIGNPINSLKMTLTVLNESLETFSGEKVQDFLKRSLHEVGRVEYLLKTLRNFNMFERPNVQSLRIDTFMEKFLSLVADDFKRKGINIETLSSPRAMEGLVDPRALHQVMLNLTTNSADALMDIENPQIGFSFRKLGEWIYIKVIDNGCGMSPEQKKDLFKPFFTSKVNGTGLGLVIVKKMLSKMNCTIDIESRENVGTTVTISIPEG